MSYILDALKKSEQERGRGNAPGVQTVHSASINYHNEKKSYWPYFLIAAVILNLVALIYFIVDKEKTTRESTVVATDVAIETNHAEALEITTDRAVIAAKENNDAEPPAEITTDSLPAISTPAATPKPNDDFKQDDFKPAISETEYREKNTRTKKTRADIIDYHDLDDSIKLQLPTITVSAHVYSSNPAQRSIVINNEFLEEGEYIMDGLVLYEITPDGAILNYQGTLFHYGVVSSWQ